MIFDENYILIKYNKKIIKLFQEVYKRQTNDRNDICDI